MKFDRKARALLLYVLLPVYVIMLGVFVWVSSFYRGKYALPQARLAADFVEFESAGYTLAQQVTVSSRKVEPGAVIDETLAEALVKAYGSLDTEIAVEKPGVKPQPSTVPATEASAQTEKFLVYPLDIGAPPAGVELLAGTRITAEVASKIEAAAASAESAVDMTVVEATSVKVPSAVEAANFTQFIDADYVLDEAVTVKVDGDEVVKEAGTILNRDILVALMRMRDDKVRGDFVKVRGKGPVIGFQYTFVFIVLNFLILVAFLYGLLWKPIINVLDKRTQTVREDLTRAKQQRKKAEDLFHKYSETMDGARADREEIIADGRREGGEERERIIAEARAEAEAILERARLAIQAEREDLRRELTQQVGAFSVDLAQNILGREITSDDHAALVDDFVGRIVSGGEDG